MWQQVKKDDTEYIKSDIRYQNRWRKLGDTKWADIKLNQTTSFLCFINIGCSNLETIEISSVMWNVLCADNFVDARCTYGLLCQWHCILCEQNRGSESISSRVIESVSHNEYDITKPVVEKIIAGVMHHHSRHSVDHVHTLAVEAWKGLKIEQKELILN